MLKAVAGLVGPILAQVDNHATKQADTEKVPTIEKAYVLCNEVIPDLLSLLIRAQLIDL